MTTKSYAASMFTFVLMFGIGATIASAGGGEFTGQFDPALIANVDDFERVVLKSADIARFTSRAAIPDDAHVAAGQILDPQTQQYTLFADLVEEKALGHRKKKPPILYVDLNSDNNLCL